MQNIHRHTSYSNIFTPDSAATNEEYAKRAVELGHKVISSVEHGWAGYYFQTFELAKKYNLKFVFGAEAYWVKDREKEYFSGKNKKGEDTYAKDRGNHHILLLAKNENGRQAINDILSEANITGYYFRPRVDVGLILSLPAEDVVVTTACIAFNGYDDIDNIIEQFYNHFKENFYLEIQYHHTDKQIEWNRHLEDLSNRLGIKLIVGLDSHYIYESDAWKRDAILEAKGVFYEDEAGWFMDYPDDQTIMERFLEQGVFNQEEIQKAMDNTDVVLNFDDYDNVSIFSKEIKLPTLYPDLSTEEKNKLYRRLIGIKFVEYMKGIPDSEYQRYYEGVKSEIQTYEDTGMVDYPLLDYEIVKDAVEHGGLITDTGRGSAVGYFTNTLCGFSKVDRFTSAIKLYPERFISTTRILETHSLPDIDLNVGTPEIFEEAQVRVLGQEHVYPMIAFGTLKKKAAFKLYAKSEGLDFTLANEISEQIGNYDEAVKKADEEEKDEIDIYDFVDKEYKEYIEKSQEYWGIISDKKKAPSAYLLYQGDIRREIGLIKCKSTSTKREYITCCIDGAIAENYKFLKNDILKVDVVLLIEKVFKRIGIRHFTVNELIEKVSNDPLVWKLYEDGYTIGLNQVEQDGSKKKCMNYKPKNVSELSAFVAAIRPGFKSMYKRFEERENFSWEIPSLDNLIRTEELPVSFLFFQEQVMSVLNYAGFPMDECYGIIKAIAKKHPEKVKPLKQKFIDGFRERLIQDEKLSLENAQDNAEKVWTIVNDNCGYGFNCVSGSTRIAKCGVNDKFNPTIEEMYKIRNDFSYARKTNHVSLRKKYLRYGYGKALSLFEDEKLRPNNIIGIYEAGIRQTYKIETESGCSLICTDNHRFPTQNGKKRLDELQIGELLYCKGEYKYESCKSGIPTYLSKIISIEPYKTEMTYDVEMASPAHTFVSESGLVTSNSAHAYCMALDSLYQAWQKAHYPYEFYETLLQHYSDKGKKTKVSALKAEMKKGFGIKEGKYRFGNDNRHFASDKENGVIYQSLASIKNISQKTADSLYKLGNNRYDNFVDLLIDIKKEKINTRQMDILIKIGYFDQFGEIGKLLKIVEIFEALYDKSQMKKNKVDEFGIPESIVREHAGKETDKMFTGVNMIGLIKDYSEIMPYEKTTFAQMAYYQFAYLGYVDLVDNRYTGYIVAMSVNAKYSPRLSIYALANGNTLTVKVPKPQFRKNPIEEGDVIHVTNQRKKQKVHMTAEGNFAPVEGEYDWWILDYEKIGVKKDRR